MKWETSCLGEICRVGDGAHASLKREKDGIPYVTAKNLLGNRIDYSKMDYISTDTYKKYFKESSTALTRPQKDDILFSIIGSIGGLYLIKKDELFGLSSSVAIFRTKEETVFPKYLFYYMNSTMFDNKIQSVRSGVAQGFLSLSKLESIEIEYPQSIEYQKSIVNHLERFDELIDKNQNQIKLLEEAAQRLYKEWFIDLRFPGHETTPIVNGIPEGWKIKRVSDFGEVITGKTPSTSHSEFFGGDIPFVKIPDMHDCIFPVSTESTLTELGANSQNKKYIPIGSIMVSCIATVGLVNISVQTCQTNQQINSIVPAKHQDLYYLYFCMKGIQSLLDGVGSNGATMTNVNKSKFENLNVIYPSNRLIERFYAFCEPIFSDILKLSVMNCKLKETRNRLLPKLMSGEIEV